MMRHLKDKDRAVHCEGAIAPGEFVLCGLAFDEEHFDMETSGTFEGIDCPECIAVIRHSQRVRGGQIKPAFKRRAAALKARAEMEK